MRRTGARHIVDALVAHGVDRVFCVPGESYLPVLDALHDVSDKIQLIACRMEAGAANMAEAHGKLTGRPGVCMVTRGPGATHASVGVHTARQDSTPMLLFIGQVATGDKGRDAFQEVDYSAFFGPLAKWAVELDDASRTHEIVDRAFATALQGRMGPVAIALPEDMLAAEVEIDVAPVRAPARGGLDPMALAEIATLLGRSRKPVLILGGSGWDEAALGNIRAFAESADLPVVASFRRKDLFDNDHPNFVGDLGLGPNPKLLARIKEADLLVTVGARLGENPTQGYTLLSRAETAEKLVHIHAGAEELGRVWPARLAATADVRATAAALGTLRVSGDWAAWRTAARTDYEAWTKPIAVTGAVNLSEVVAHIVEVTPKDTIFTNGAGNYAAWLHRFVRHRASHTQLAPTSGAMGYGVPAAIAAKFAHPSREVIAFAGDGCFLMTGQELATAVQYEANIVIVVVDNGSYGTIRMHQERHFPGRVSATDLRNPDFAAFARSFGAWAGTVEKTSEFAPIFAEARQAGRPALIHIKTDVEDISPGRTITALRAGR